MKPLYTNRLIREKSPYLLQHAHNPVDWYPWGEEAFKAARLEDKPIFLSSGYATCHWCHVMARETFENIEVAQLLNHAFINIKIDREELPEIDSLYMEFAQSMIAGAVGWPLNVVLTPDLQPIFATTYLPPFSRQGMMGVKELIEKIQEVWLEGDREQLLVHASQLVELYTENVHFKGFELPEKEELEEAVDNFFKLADPLYGGMKGAPKFPIGYHVNFMLRYSAVTQEARAIFLSERTLEMMQRGGIYDHIGGGFSRYSTDEKWKVPHFEKMLYDNALLILSYLEGWQVTKNPLYRQVCEETICYVLREMTHTEGGFYSAQDADSEGGEGNFYVWTQSEIINILGKESGKLFCEFYNITEEGNFEAKRNILYAELSLEEFAIQKGIEPPQMEALLNAQKKILWKARERRPKPFKDDKILTSWNGLMIDSIVQAGMAWGDHSCIEAGVKAARFIYENMWDGELYRRWREGEAMHSGGLEDYAFLIRALITLFESNQGIHWLEWARELCDILKERFKGEAGAFFQTDGSDPHVLLRKCHFSDGAEPSGNAIHCENLLRLYQLTEESEYLSQAEDIMRAVKKYIDSYSPGYCYHLLNLNRYYDVHAPTLIIALNDSEDLREEITRLIYQEFIPHKAVIWRRANDEKAFRHFPLVGTQIPIDGKTTLYVCDEGGCKAPVTEFSEMKRLLSR